MDVLQPFVPLGNSGTVPRGRRLESALVCLRGGGKWMKMMGFTVFFYTLFEQGGCACGGTVACDKTSVYATSRSGGVGEGGCHHATSRCGNVDKNNQKHYKNEYNNNTTTTKKRTSAIKQTNKQTKIKETRSKERHKQTHKQPTKKQTHK